MLIIIPGALISSQHGLLHTQIFFKKTLFTARPRQKVFAATFFVFTVPFSIKPFHNFLWTSWDEAKPSSSRFGPFSYFFRFSPFLAVFTVQGLKKVTGTLRRFLTPAHPIFLYPHAKNQPVISPLRVFRGGCDSSSMLMSHGARSKKLLKPYIGGQCSSPLGCLSGMAMGRPPWGPPSLAGAPAHTCWPVLRHVVGTTVGCIFFFFSRPAVLAQPGPTFPQPLMALASGSWFVRLGRCQVNATGV